MRPNVKSSKFLLVAKLAGLCFADVNVGDYLVRGCARGCVSSCVSFSGCVSCCVILYSD